MDWVLRFSIIVLGLLHTSLAADTAQWKSRNIYFALTDRLARDNDTGGSSCQDLSTYCGGTFQGLQSKLNYIQGMGFDAIWITPVVTNSENGYHGYWAQDLDSINSHYGTADDLKSLVDAAHELKMYVMVDVVANHMGYANISQDGPTLMTQNSSYHPYCDIDYNNQTSVQECWISGLPDVYTEKDEIRSLYQNWVRNLVSTYGFDGLRIDTVRQVEKEFWQLFVQAAGVYAVGEVFDGDASYVGGYQSAVPGLLNYPMYYPLNAFYQQKGSSQAVVDAYDNITAHFTDPTALGNFVDNHDNPRFLSQKNDQALLKNALTYVMLSRGIPIVYYGTEQAYAGANDPDNREDLWHSYYNASTDLYSTLSKLSSARKTAGGLSEDDQVFLLVEDTGLVWSRANGSLIAVTSNSGTGSSKSYCFDSKVPNGAWTDVLGAGTYSAGSNGSVCATTQNGAPLVLLASDASSGNGSIDAEHSQRI